MRGGVDVMPHRSPYAIEGNQKKTHLMSSQGIKHFLYTRKQPLKDPKKVVFSGVEPYQASSGDMNLPRENRK